MTGLARADRLDFALLDGAQQLHLRRRRQFADLIKKQGAAVGLDEFAGVALGGAGEGAFLVAEQDRLDEIFRHRAAIDRDERLAAARSLEPWMARAINSLPTPDSPPIRTGMADAARFLGDAEHGLHRHESVMMSAKPSVPDAACFIRCNSPSSALALSALRMLHCKRSAPTGLTTKSTAPARIAETTLSMPPCAVCTITGTARPACAHLGEHAEPVEIGHDQIENDAIDVGPIGPGEQGERGIAVVARLRRVLELVQHPLE